MLHYNHPDFDNPDVVRERVKDLKGLYGAAQRYERNRDKWWYKILSSWWFGLVLAEFLLFVVIGVLTLVTGLVIGLIL